MKSPDRTSRPATVAVQTQKAPSARAKVEAPAKVAQAAKPAAGKVAKNTTTKAAAPAPKPAATASAATPAARPSLPGLGAPVFGSKSGSSFVAQANPPASELPANSPKLKAAPVVQDAVRAGISGFADGIDLRRPVQLAGRVQLAQGSALATPR